MDFCNLKTTQCNDNEWVRSISYAAPDHPSAYVATATGIAGQTAPYYSTTDSTFYSINGSAPQITCCQAVVSASTATACTVGTASPLITEVCSGVPFIQFDGCTSTNLIGTKACVASCSPNAACNNPGPNDGGELGDICFESRANAACTKASIEEFHWTCEMDGGVPTWKPYSDTCEML
jgi:hypothetical protein